MLSLKILFTVLFLLPNLSYAAEILKNTGLIPSNVWYSKDPFYVGDRVRIYSVIFNGSGKDLHGRINFYDNNSLLCTSDFSSLSGRTSEIWCDWSVPSGKHGISIKIVNPRASFPGEEEQAVLLANSELVVDERSIELAAIETKKISSGTLPTENMRSGSGFIENVASLFSNLITTRPESLPSTSNRESKRAGALQVDSGRGGSAPKSVGEKVLSDVKNVKSKSDQDKGGHILKNNQGDDYLDENLTSIYSVLTAIKNNFSSFFTSIKDRILSKLKILSAGDNKPLAYTMLFLYLITRFVLSSQIILTLLAVYIFWKVVKMTIYR